MFSKILVAYDGSDSCHDVLDEAIEIAATFHSQVNLVAVVHLSTGELLAEAAYPIGLRPGQEEPMRKTLAAAAKLFSARGCPVEANLLIDNDPAAAIRDMALAAGVDLIVLGHRRQGPLSRLWNGSVGLTLLANAPCSILVAVPAEQRKKP